MSTIASNTKKKILVLGANGKTGSRVMQRLTKLGWPVQAGSRSSTPKFDWDDHTPWKPARQKGKAAYIFLQRDLAIPWVVETVRQFTETAEAQGVEKLVLLSGRGETEAQQCENVVMGAGVEWT